MFPRLRRRRFLQSAALAFSALIVPLRQAWAAVFDVPWAGKPGDKPYLNRSELAFVTAAAERLIPADETGPGAKDLGVAHYIDRQLAGEYGRAERWYMQGPFKPGTPSQGYQLPYTPAQLFRASVAAADKHCRQQYGGRTFPQLKPEEQDGLLKQMQDGKLTLPDTDIRVFFNELHGMTLEGYFADPQYGGNRDMGGWKVVGFPGARGAYIAAIDDYNKPFTEPPVAIASGGSGHGHS